MNKFKKAPTEKNPEISTASLPDIIFILLFFFMVVTVIREDELKVMNRLPQATELNKLERKSLVDHIFIGSPVQPLIEMEGNTPRIQLADQFASLEDVQPYILEGRKQKLKAEQEAMTVALRIDREVTMGIVSDVKLELRKINALKINYSALKAR